MSWSVYVFEGSPNLVCPTCKEEIEKLKKEQAEVIDAEIIEEGS